MKKNSRKVKKEKWQNPSFWNNHPEYIKRLVDEQISFGKLVSIINGKDCIPSLDHLKLTSITIDECKKRKIRKKGYRKEDIIHYVARKVQEKNKPSSKKATTETIEEEGKNIVPYSVYHAINDQEEVVTQQIIADELEERAEEDPWTKDLQESLAEDQQLYTDDQKVDGWKKKRNLLYGNTTHPLMEPTGGDVEADYCITKKDKCE